MTVYQCQHYGQDQLFICHILSFCFSNIQNLPWLRLLNRPCKCLKTLVIVASNLSSWERQLKTNVCLQTFVNSINSSVNPGETFYFLSMAMFLSAAINMLEKNNLPFKTGKIACVPCYNVLWVICSKRSYNAIRLLHVETHHLGYWRHTWFHISA